MWMPGFFFFFFGSPKNSSLNAVCVLLLHIYSRATGQSSFSILKICYILYARAPCMPLHIVYMYKLCFVDADSLAAARWRRLFPSEFYADCFIFFFSGYSIVLSFFSFCFVFNEILAQTNYMLYIMQFSCTICK